MLHRPCMEFIEGKFMDADSIVSGETLKAGLVDAPPYILGVWPGRPPSCIHIDDEFRSARRTAQGFCQISGERAIRKSHSYPLCTEVIGGGAVVHSIEVM